MAHDAPITLRLGTRGSLLARAQSNLIAGQLESLHPGLKIEITIIRTSGDQIAEKPLHEFGGKGLFTKELEQALLAGEVDFAVHSFKDVPITMPLVDQTELIIAAVPSREDPRDVLICAVAKSIADLPKGSLVGTGSLRRRAQLLAARPDLKVEMIRGNIDTRLRKCEAGEFDAIILAMAGLKRAGLFDAHRMTALDPAELLPAPGQGALALQCRRDDHQTRKSLSLLNDPITSACVTAERELVRLLEGDCHSPIAALAESADDAMTMRAAVGARDGNPPVITASHVEASHDPIALAQAVIAMLIPNSDRPLKSSGA